MSRIRILHVVGAMNRGGVETWLMNVLRNIDRTRFRMDFLVHTDKPASYDEEIAGLGSDVIPCLGPGRPWTYSQGLRRILRARAPYDVIHSHVHHYSGLILRIAARQGIPIRIAHSHNDTTSLDLAAGVFRRQYLRVTKHWIAQYATHRVACSTNAAGALFGQAEHSGEPWMTLPCSIDLTAFDAPRISAAMRRELGIPEGKLIVGHVGRFAEQKNHGFLLDIAAELAVRRRDVCMLLVGDGPLRPDVERQILKRGLSGHVKVLGARTDVNRLMMNVMNVFVLPSLYEGLPVVMIEAQAAGLPCIVSDVITREADLVPGLVCRRALSDSAGVWADEILAADERGHNPSPSQALRDVKNTAYNLQRALPQLERLYSSSMLPAGA
ncbi:MAG: glycosyltransferase family 1 protein [Nitrospiraceae bacterium]|nr:glycosyltransferase family 1 protein [Nitrospiraceae bacterium]